MKTQLLSYRAVIDKLECSNSSSQPFSYYRNFVYVLNCVNFYFRSRKELQSFISLESSPIWRLGELLASLGSYVEYLYGPISVIELGTSFYKGEQYLDITFKNNLYETVCSLCISVLDVEGLIRLDSLIIDSCTIFMLRPGSYDSKSRF